MTFRENRRNDVMAAIEIRRQFWHQIGVPIAQLKMMMRINNGKARLQSRLPWSWKANRRQAMFVLYQQPSVCPPDEYFASFE